MKKKLPYLYFLIPVSILSIVLYCGLKTESNGYRKVNGGYLYRFQSEKIKTVYTEEFQNEMEEKIEEIKTSRNFTFQNLLMISNPYQTNTNALYIYFQTNQKLQLRYTIHVNDNNIKDYTQILNNDSEDNLTTEHEYLLTGIIPDRVNKITLELLDNNKNVVKTKTIEFQANSLLGSEKIKLDSVTGSSKEKLTDGLYTILGNDSEKQDFIYLYDNQGILRGEIPIIGYRAHRILWKDGLAYFSVSETKMVAMNRLGKIEKIYSLGNYELHHDYVFGENGNLLILATDTKTDTVEDIIITLDLETGTVSKTIDLNSIFSAYKEKTELPKDEKTLDWMHINSIQYIEEDNSVILSSRETSTIIKLKNINSTPEIDYLIGSNEFWKDTEYQDKLLTKIGDFTLQGGQHAVTISYDDSLNDGEYYLYMYNNNIGVSTTRPNFDWKSNYPNISTTAKDDKNNSTYYQYLVNENEKTFTLVDSFDVDYSGYVSSVQNINSNTVVDSGMVHNFGEYDKNHELIIKFSIPSEKFVYRVYKYDYKNFWYQ